jgi:hypothetical protein
MTAGPKALLASLAVTGVLVALPQAAGADPLPGWTLPGGAVGVGVPSNGLGASPCGTGVAGGQGSPAAPAVCAAGLSFVGPTTGQIASVVGPTIISPAVIGNTIVVNAGGNVVAP